MGKPIGDKDLGVKSWRGEQGTLGGGTTWGNNPNVVPYLDNIYAYLKARSNGALRPGRPEKLNASHKAHLTGGRSS